MTTHEAKHLGLAVVAGYYGVPTTELSGRSRRAEFTRARHMAMRLLRDVTGLPVMQIGRLLARDHSTVISGLRRIDADMQCYPAVRGDYAEIRSRFERVSGGAANVGGAA